MQHPSCLHCSVVYKNQLAFVIFWQDGVPNFEWFSAVFLKFYAAGFGDFGVRFRGAPRVHLGERPQVRLGERRGCGPAEAFRERPQV